MSFTWKRRHVGTQFRHDARRGIGAHAWNGIQQFNFLHVWLHQFLNFSFQRLDFTLQILQMIQMTPDHLPVMQAQSAVQCLHKGRHLHLQPGMNQLADLMHIQYFAIHNRVQ
ncbi:hypothetical protein D3C85_1617240 [compost metagenome]